MRIALLPAIVAAVAAAGQLAGCGSSPSGSPSASPSPSPSSSATASGSASPSAAANRALTVAMSATDMPAPASSYTQSSDGLLGGTPNTDSRVFTSSDGSVKVEVDVAVDTSALAAGGDYAAFSTAAAKQVPNQQTTSTPAIGSKANECVGTDAGNLSTVSIAFLSGSVIAVVTEKASSGTVDPALAESIATAQVAKISSAGL